MTKNLSPDEHTCEPPNQEVGTPRKLHLQIHLNNDNGKGKGKGTREDQDLVRIAQRYHGICLLKGSGL